jgi:hypothetical protein
VILAIVAKLILSARFQGAVARTPWRKSSLMPQMAFFSNRVEGNAADS